MNNFYFFSGGTCVVHVLCCTSVSEPVLKAFFLVLSFILIRVKSSLSIHGWLNVLRSLIFSTSSSTAQKNVILPAPHCHQLGLDFGQVGYSLRLGQTEIQEWLCCGWFWVLCVLTNLAEKLLYQLCRSCVEVIWMKFEFFQKQLNTTMQALSYIFNREQYLRINSCLLVRWQCFRVDQHLFQWVQCYHLDNFEKQFCVLRKHFLHLALPAFSPFLKTAGLLPAFVLLSITASWEKCSLLGAYLNIKEW